MFITDLNVHSNFSDGKLSIPELVDLYGKRGFGAIAITDLLCESKSILGRAAVYMNRTLTPAVFPLYMEILRSEAKRAKAEYDMVVLPGYELTKNSVINQRSARMLGIGIHKFTSADADARAIAASVRAQGGVTIAEPTGELWARKHELTSSFDAWDAASQRSRALSEAVLESGLPKIAARCMKSALPQSSWKTVFSCARSAEAILKAIRNQDLSFTFYAEEKSDDVRHWIDVNDLRAGAVGLKPVRDGLVGKTLPSGTWRLNPTAAAGFNTQAPQRH